jgi:hypothetical protein
MVGAPERRRLPDSSGIRSLAAVCARPRRGSGRSLPCVLGPAAGGGHQGAGSKGFPESECGGGGAIGHGRVVWVIAQYIGDGAARVWHPDPERGWTG